MMKIYRSLTLLLLLCVPETARSQDAATPEATIASEGTVTLDDLFTEERFDGEDLPNIRWMEDGRHYTVLEPATFREPATGPEAPDDAESPQRGANGPLEPQDLVRYDAVTGKREILVAARSLIPAGFTEPLVIEDYTFSGTGDLVLVYTNSERVWRNNTRGDYWLFEVATGRLAKLGGDAAPQTLMFAKLSPDGKRVAYVRERNLYVESSSGGEIVQLTDDGAGTVINGTFDWVYEEELGLDDGFRWSPDSRQIAYWQLDTSGTGTFHLLDNTAGLYPRLKTFQYPKVGTTNSSCRIGVVNAGGGETRWLRDHDDPRDHYLARMEWAGSSREIAVQHLNRPQNALSVLLGDPSAGRYRTLLVDRDDAWTDAVDEWSRLGDGDRFVWISERDGWRHAYLVARDGRETKLLTPGDFDVVSVEAVDEEGGWLYFIASPEAAGERHFFRAPLDGSGKAERLTPTGSPGTHSYDVAPGGAWAIHTYSRFGVPPVVDLVHLPDHSSRRVLVANVELKQRALDLRRGPSRFFKVPIGEGVELDGWEMRPADFDPSKKYPILFFVYGEPWGQTVQDRWGRQRYLWHLMLTQQGYLVVSVDNRGTSAPRGRDWRKMLYKQVGVLSSEEQAAAAREILAWPYVDESRVAIWGWSGGGSMTLNMLFRYPDLYHTGMSVAPVPDQRLYDTIYQERYQGLPEENPEVYTQGSPITFAEQLEGNLLIVHGTGDDNVHYQGTEALINKLVAHNKPFTMMAYPNRSHRISEEEGTTRHLYELLTRYLHENLPAGSR